MNEECNECNEDKIFAATSFGPTISLILPRFFLLLKSRISIKLSKNLAPPQGAGTPAPGRAPAKDKGPALAMYLLGSVLMGRRRCAALVVIATIVCLSLSGVASQEEEEYFWHNGKAVHAGSFRTPHVSDLTPRLNTVRRIYIYKQRLPGSPCGTTPNGDTGARSTGDITMSTPKPKKRPGTCRTSTHGRTSWTRTRKKRTLFSLSLSLLIDRSDAPDPEPDVSRTAALPPPHTHTQPLLPTYQVLPQQKHQGGDLGQAGAVWLEAGGKEKGGAVS